MNNQYSKSKKLLLINILSLIIYILYLEIDPKITGIWVRKNSNNKYIVSFSGLKNLFLYPFKEFRMWLYPSMWRVNPFISITLISGIIYCFTEYINR